MNNAIDNWNYANDARTQGPAEKPILYCDDGTEMELPMRWGVCPVCDGNGTHVNPSIDAGGLSSEDFCEDHEFGEAYMDGVYDVTCNRCEGKRVVPVVDWDAMGPDLRMAYSKQLEQEAADHAEHLAEIRAGC